MTKNSKKAKRQKLSKKNDDLNLTDSSSSSDSSSDSDSSTSSSSSSSSSNSSSSSSSGSSSTNSSNLSNIDIKTLDANKRLPGDEAPRSKSISYQQQTSSTTTTTFRGGRAGRGVGVRVRGGSFSHRATYINHQNYAQQQQPGSTPSPQPTPRTSTDSSSTTATTTTAGGGGGASGSGVALKLVLKRAGGGNSYKVKSLNAYSANRPKREAAQRAENLYKHLIEDENDEMADVEEDVEYERPTRVSSRRQSTNNTTNAAASSVQYYQQPAIKKRRQSSATTTNSSASTSMQAISEQDWLDEQLEQQKPQEFYPSDIVQGVSIEEKMLILLKKQCYVRLNHPKPFAIALVDDETSIVHTKALLLNHLFQSYQSPCILCVLCKQFLTVQQFSKHLHDNKPTKKQQSFSILPYSTSGSITPSDMQTWKLFSKLYVQYKNENKKLKEQQQQQQQQAVCGGDDENGVSRTSITSVSSIVSTKSGVGSNGGGGGIASSKRFKSFQGQIFYDWDYIEKSTNKSKNLYWLSILRLNNENIVYVNENSKIDAPLNHNKDKEKQQKDDLVLSDDEEAAVDHHTPTAVTSTSNADDVVSNKENHEMDVDVELKSQATSSSNTSTHVDPQMPSMSKLYMNFYDNLSYDILLYICDNQYTIIPISYIEFINYKRNQIINNYSVNTKIINNYSLINSY